MKLIFVSYKKTIFYFKQSISMAFFSTLLMFFILFIFNKESFASDGVYFNPSFLSSDPSSVADLSSFESGMDVPPGTYNVDVYLNDIFVFNKDITFFLNKENLLSPCFEKNTLIEMGVSLTSLPKESENCLSLVDFLKGSTVDFNAGEQKLHITIPQIFMSNNHRGYIPPEYWENGIVAGMVNYNLSGNKSKSNGIENDYLYLNLKSGVNFGAWRFRDESFFNYSSLSSKKELKHINSWLERGISVLRSTLTIGDTQTSNEIFDSYNIRGIQLSSDDNMLPESERGFAPEINGVAQGTALVTINQNGYSIYSVTVPPGPFVIKDLYPSSNGGDLQVLIREANGAIQTFTVPYASVPMLQRLGKIKYSISAGKFRGYSSSSDHPNVIQTTIMRGFPFDITLYGGAVLANKYRAINLGIGKNLNEFGAFSTDITSSRAELNNGNDSNGKSVRFVYSKSFPQSKTNFNLVGYRYTTEGFYTLGDVAYKDYNYNNVYGDNAFFDNVQEIKSYPNITNRRKGKASVNISQKIGDNSSLYVNGSRETYWDNKKSTDQLQIGFSTFIDSLSLSIAYSVTNNIFYKEKDKLLSFSLNIPFSHFMRTDSQSPLRKVNSTYSYSNDMNGQVTNSAGLYGTLLEDDNLGYNIQTGYIKNKNQSSGQTGLASLYYKGGNGSSSIGYSHSNNDNQLYYGVSGGAIIHSNGITLGQSFNDTAILIKAPSAKNVKIENQSGVVTDSRGYGILPYASDYKDNRVSVDLNSLPDNIEIENNVVSVIPTKGAIGIAQFDVNVGVKALFTINKNGEKIPFGAMAKSDISKSVGIVDDSGRVYLSGLPLKGKLLVSWGSDKDQQCSINYTIEDSDIKSGIATLSKMCN